MDIVLQHDPALVRFGQAVSSAYGDAVERVVLYGSRARGDARPDADYDIAVFLTRYVASGLLFSKSITSSVLPSK